MLLAALNEVVDIRRSMSGTALSSDELELVLGPDGEPIYQYRRLRDALKVALERVRRDHADNLDLDHPEMVLAAEIAIAAASVITEPKLRHESIQIVIETVASTALANEQDPEPHPATTTTGSPIRTPGSNDQPLVSDDDGHA